MTPGQTLAAILGVTATVLVAIALLLGTCSSGETIDRQQLLIVTANASTARLQVEIAETAEERAQGLMGRTELPPDTGMLFVIEPPGRGFWMKGTRIPLTVAFIAGCGEIVDFADLEPLSEEIKNTDQPYDFALEVDQGWFDRNGIAIGDTVLLPPDVRPDGC
jgi:uncharacterized protein